MKKIGIIIATDDESWKGEEGLGKYFLERFRKVDSSLEYEIIHGVTGALPQPADFAQYSGFVISGSPYSVNDPFPWIRNLETFVLQLHEYNNKQQNSKIYLVGICYGHQLIAKAFGATVEKTKYEKKFVYGSEKIDLTHEICKRKWFQSVLGTKRTDFRIMQIHGEEVVNMPSNVLNVGKSPTCETEVFLYGDEIFTVQGHPEMTVATMLDKIGPRLLKRNLVDEKMLEEGKETSKIGDTDLLVKLCAAFLKHQL